MPLVTIDGIQTRYETLGSGPPILMFSPGGFNATLDAWSSVGVYARTKPLEYLSRHYTCIVFDRRETGQSGGRIERVAWADYVAQGKGLLDHLGVGRAHVMGGCLGCSSAVAFGVAHPSVARSLVLYWPAGGAKYRSSSQERFAVHLDFVQQHGLEKVVALTCASGKSFSADPRCGPWAAVLRSDPAFARLYAAYDLDKYKLIVAATSRTLFDRDTVPGAEVDDLVRLQLPALIIPGNDDSHATSAARYLQECLPLAQYWDVSVGEQTEERVRDRLLEFLAAHLSCEPLH
jgi:pimeloyl-ACP methyl ester carboxylesterase